MGIIVFLRTLFSPTAFGWYIVVAALLFAPDPASGVATVVLAKQFWHDARLDRIEDEVSHGR